MVAWSDIWKILMFTLKLLGVINELVKPQDILSTQKDQDHSYALTINYLKKKAKEIGNIYQIDNFKYSIPERSDTKH